ncbi:MAG: (Fe-S)-binding protein [Bacteroidales bacterium]|nr:(Fe-S)-binding protein [Bacteroidales bacterium]MBN2748697.1 (Fe-S)-binding protein [Bacteroidales bacterium]
MSYYHHFVIPFTAGLLFLVIVVAAKWIIWIKGLNNQQKRQVKGNIFTKKSLLATWEVLAESLFHRKVFKKNFLLGYMHMSLALGWFLLIAMGNLETRIFTHGQLNPPYVPIFFEFFEHDLSTLRYKEIFTFVMDFLLLFVLSGVALAYFKRATSKPLGMKQATKHAFVDKLALTSLWLIFPLRLAAESVTAGLYGTGGFFTRWLGEAIAPLPAIDMLYYPLWWAYSLSLGLFFISVPFTRYMHIPTETLLIFLRKYGIKETEKHTSYTQVELNACSRCGICIDSCQLSSELGISSSQSTYFLKSLRDKKATDYLTETCMLCGRCDYSCPVGIENSTIRLNQRRESPATGTSFGYVPAIEASKGKIAFFAGCMGQLTPSVTRATLALFDAADVEYTHIDKDATICCGRPLQVNGEENAARELAQKNKQLIEGTGAEALVTTCPICARIFAESYELSIPVYHHTQFLYQLAASGQLKLAPSNNLITYHDPCELGRGLGVYDEPRELLKFAGNLVEVKSSKTNSLCCGGSLAITSINQQQRNQMARKTLQSIGANDVDFVATACPLCKKTFTAASDENAILDISEILVKAFANTKQSSKPEQKQTAKETSTVN